MTIMAVKNVKNPNVICCSLMKRKKVEGKLTGNIVTEYNFSIWIIRLVPFHALKLVGLSKSGIGTGPIFH